MGKVELQNNDKKIGLLDICYQSIKNMDIKFKLTAGLAFGVVTLALASCGTKDKVEPEPVEEIETNENSITLKEELENFDIKEEDLDDKDHYKVVDDNGETHYYTEDELRINDYMLIDTIDTKYSFIIGFNDDLISHLRKEKPNIDFSEFDEKYQFFRSVYEEYIDGKQYSQAHKDYILFLEDDLIKTIENTNLAFYKRVPVRFNEYMDIMFPQEEPYSRKATIEYTVPKDTSLSEIVDSYADDKEEYRETFDKVVEINDIKNPDLIIANETLTLPNVDFLDAQNVFGYTFEDTYNIPKNFTKQDELEQRYNWINKKVNEIQLLPGDMTFEENLGGLDVAVKAFNESYEEYQKGNVPFQIVYEDSITICDTIGYLKGEYFSIVYPAAEILNSRTTPEEKEEQPKAVEEKEKDNSHKIPDLTLLASEDELHKTRG